MNRPNNEPIAYFVPGEVILGFAAATPGGSRASPELGSLQAVTELLQAEGLMPPSGFDLKASLRTVQLPRPASRGPVARGDEARSTVLAKLRLGNPAELSAYLGQLARKLREEEATPRAADGGLRLSFAQPNWLGGTAQTGIGTGGPGGRPTPLTQRPYGQATEFSFPILERMLAEWKDARRPVNVYILDTIPGKLGGPSTGGPVHLPMAIADDAEFARHPLGKVLKAGFQVLPDGSWQSPDGDLTLTWAEDLQPGVFADLFEADGVTPAYYLDDHDPTPPHEPYPVADHGIFIAGIVRQIAPQARLHLIEVLNRYGVGTLESVANGFAEVARRRGSADDGGQSVYLINCSLTFAVPVLDRVVKAAHALPATHPLYALMQDDAFQSLTRRFFAAVVPSAQDLGISLKEIRGQDEVGLVVAAAGNDSDVGQGIRLDARYPANVGSVLGVGALARDFTIWTHSNVADTPATAGLATLGVLQSLYTQEFPGGQPNPYGFAEWAGTSFATAVITGYLAKVCGWLGMTPRQALSFLGDFTSPEPSTGEARLRVEQPHAAPVS